MNLILLAIGAYIAWRIMASRSGKPSQESEVWRLQPPSIEPSPPPKTITIYLDRNRVFMVERFATIINAVAASLNMPSDIIRALIYVQSGGDDAARTMQPDSEYGYGLTQITCGRAKKLGEDPTLEKVTPIKDCLDLETPINSVYYGVLYLKALYQGDWTAALALYYSPTGNLWPTESAIEKAKLTLSIANSWQL